LIQQHLTQQLVTVETQPLSLAASRSENRNPVFGRGGITAGRSTGIHGFKIRARDFHAHLERVLARSH
jgi:hypothetical protein